MNYLFLKAESREGLIEVLKNSGMWDEQFKPITQGDAFDEIGLIYAPTGNTIETAMGPQPERAPIPGWHANMLLHGEVPEALEAISIPEPANPRRIFGGWKSAAQIAAEEAARAEL